MSSLFTGKYLRRLYRTVSSAWRFHNRLCKRSGICIGVATLVSLNNDPVVNKYNEKLGHMYLIKNASIACVDSATSLLTQTVSNLIELEEQYATALEDLSAILSQSIAHLDDEYKQAIYWDTVIEIRDNVAKLKAERQDMEAIYHAAVRMLNASGEAALISGAEYASTAAGERVFSAQSQVRARQERRAECEVRAARVEARYIHEISEHHRRKQAESERVAEDADDVLSPGVPDDLGGEIIDSLIGENDNDDASFHSDSTEATRGLFEDDINNHQPNEETELLSDNTGKYQSEFKESDNGSEAIDEKQAEDLDTTPERRSVFSFLKRQPPNSNDTKPT